MINQEPLNTFNDFKNHFGDSPLILEPTTWRINQTNQFLMFNTIIPNGSKQLGTRLTDKGSSIAVKFDFNLKEVDNKLFFIESDGSEYEMIFNPSDVNSWKMASPQTHINLSREYLIVQGIV